MSKERLSEAELMLYLFTQGELLCCNCQANRFISTTRYNSFIWNYRMRNGVIR